MTSKRCASLVHSTPLPRAGPAADLVDLAHQYRSFVAQAPFGQAPHCRSCRLRTAYSRLARAPRAAPSLLLPMRPALSSRVGRATRAAALVARAPRALVSRERRALHAAVLVARSSCADSALASRKRANNNALVELYSTHIRIFPKELMKFRQNFRVLQAVRSPPLEQYIGLVPTRLWS